MPLEQALEPLALETAFAMEGLNDPTLPLPEMGESCLEIEDNLRGIAIGMLLARANSDAFHHNLIRAATAWQSFLLRCRQDGQTDDHNYCAGLFAPLHDAITARQWPLAAAVVEASPSDFREGHEHEDDYCYARVLHGLVTGTPAAGELPALLDRCAAEGDKMSKARVAVLRAVLRGDQDAFDASFEGLLEARRQEIEAAKERGQLAGPTVQAQRRVFIEGLALLNLAEQRGLTLAPEYPMCPSLARAPMRKPVVW